MFLVATLVVQNPFRVLEGATKIYALHFFSMPASRLEYDIMLLALPMSLTTPAVPSPPADASAAKLERHQENTRGLSLWKEISSAVLLHQTHRASGPLEKFLQAMRAGQLTAAHWSILHRRLIRPFDPRLQEEKFWSPSACVGVLRHTARAIATLHRARQLARRSSHRLHGLPCC